jgi:hypothetical protein
MLSHRRLVIIWSVRVSHRYRHDWDFDIEPWKLLALKLCIVQLLSTLMRTLINCHDHPAHYRKSFDW